MCDMKQPGGSVLPNTSGRLITLRHAAYTGEQHARGADRLPSPAALSLSHTAPIHRSLKLRRLLAPRRRPREGHDGPTCCTRSVRQRASCLRNSDRGITVHFDPGRAVSGASQVCPTIMMSLGPGTS